MRTLARWLGSITALMLLALAVNARADEEKIPLSKVPDKVLTAVKEKFPGAKLISASTEKEDGETLYEVALKYKEQNIDVELKADGTIVEIEKEIKVEDLPEAVTSALKDKYSKATFKKAEEVIKKDKLEYYEVVVQIGENREFEVQVDPKGKILKDGSKKE